MRPNANGYLGDPRATIMAPPRTERRRILLLLALLSSSVVDARTAEAFTIIPNQISISGVSAEEGTTGATTFSFAVTVTRSNCATFSVDYATASGTATSLTDFFPNSGTLTFSTALACPATQTQIVEVSVTGDAFPEPDETFTVTLSGIDPSGVTLIDAGVATGVIRNDDGAVPAITVGAARVVEGDSGTTTMSFRATLSAASGLPISFAYQTADGTASSATDYTRTSGRATFPAGTTSLNIPVVVLGDAIDEVDETFTLGISSPDNAAIAVRSATGTILDDDGPRLAISDVTIAEGDAGTSEAAFEVRLDAASVQVVTVDYETADDTATGGLDYTATRGTLSFPVRSTTQTIRVPVVGDVSDENDETFRVTLSNPSGATIVDGEGQATILDDDDAPSLSISDGTSTEGTGGATTMTFRVALSAASGRTITVGWATSDGTATAAADFTAGQGVLTFSPGVTSRTITVVVIADALDEANETFSVSLSNPSNATIRRGTAEGVIVDDDEPPTLSIGNTTVTEGDVGLVRATFSVSLSAASSREIRVAWRTADGTAEQPADYRSASGTLTLSPGETSNTIGVDVEGDAIDEPNETFRVILESPVNATLSETAYGTATIRDDDEEPTLSIHGANATEGDAAQGPMRFGVSLSAPSAYEVSVAFATHDGSARQGDDYIAQDGTLTFAPGEVSKSIDIELLDDEVAEDDEAFSVELSAPTRATLDPSHTEAIGLIRDDEARPDLAVVITADEPWVVDEADQYRFQITNVGSEPSEGIVEVRQTFPTGLSIESAAGEDWSCILSDEDLACSTLRVVVPGLTLPEVLVNATADAAAFPTLTLTATVTVMNDARSSNDAYHTSVAVLGRSDLGLSFLAPSGTTVSPTTSDPIRVVLRVRNAGPNAIAELQLELSSSPSPSLEALAVTYTPTHGHFDAATGVWSELQLTASSTASLEIQFDVPSPIPADRTLTFTAQGEVPASVIDPNLIDNTATLTLTFAERTDGGGVGGDDAGVGPGDGGGPDGGEACADDDDGLTAAEEAELGTDPCDGDSDDDGLSDFIEVKGGYPTDPLNPDTDNDGLCDGPSAVSGRCVAGEDRNANGRVDEGETNPRNADTDNGGINDGDEVRRGTDPLASQDDELESCDCRAVATSPHGASASSRPPAGTGRNTLAIVLLLVSALLVRGLGGASRRSRRIRFGAQDSITDRASAAREG
ncbi:MAG: hypothetical protein IPK13_00835 [Deltaproteobacteria bacterium]|nr:hypothetical protein [Deltaproteobacteria bacterium]